MFQEKSNGQIQLMPEILSYLFADGDSLLNTFPFEESYHYFPNLDPSRIS